MISISLCMIVKNEEETLGRCLDSVRDLMDEIVIVDTGSTDGTREIARRYTENVHSFPWVDDFAAARNHSFKWATKDYVIWLDADDVMTEENRAKFARLKRTLDPDVDVVTMLYTLSVDQHGRPVIQSRRERLVKRIRGFLWKSPVHEYLEVSGNFHHSEIEIRHAKEGSSGTRNLEIYRKLEAEGNEFTSRDLYYYGTELTAHQYFKAALQTFETYFGRDTQDMEDSIAACGHAAHCCHVLGKKEEELAYLLRTFRYDTPRGEFCCRIAHYFYELRDYRKAAKWFELATELEVPNHTLGVTNLCCYTWLPHLQLAVCYGALGEVEAAHRHNEIARSYLPDDPGILENKRRLEDFMNGRKEAPRPARERNSDG